MLHIPILRNGTPYESVDKVEIVHHATGEPVAMVSQANSGMVTRDFGHVWPMAPLPINRTVQMTVRGAEVTIAVQT